MQEYQYKPLQHSESIRVLVLHPALNANSPIRCHFLDKNPILPRIDHDYLSGRVNMKPSSSYRGFSRPKSFPAYEALSYVWGDPSDPVPIFLSTRRTVPGMSEDRQFPAARNLFAALRSLRNRFSKRLPWVDAICIDQSNLQEKAAQVRLMGRVYAASHRVVVYLGEATPSSHLLFRELKLASRAPRLKTHWSERVHRFYTRSPLILRDPPSKAVVDAMNDLFKRPYFERVWVLQEAFHSLMASEPVITLVCGTSQSPIGVLFQCVHGYKDKRAVTSLPLPIQYGTLGTEFDSDPTLWLLLLQSRRFQATNPRDRVFALRTLIPREDQTLDALIDYEKSEEEVFTNVATYLLSDMSVDLWLLKANRHPHQRPMPSWVPDWSQNTPVDRVLEFTDLFGRRDERFRTPMQLQTRAYSLEERRLIDPTIPNVGPYLHVKGREFSRIETTSPEIAFDEIFRRDARLDDPWRESYCGASKGSYPRAIIQGVQDWQYESQLVIQLLLRMDLRHDKKNWDHLKRLVFEDRILNQDPLLRGSLEWKFSWPDTFERCVLFSDTRGNVGLAPPQAAVGDAIYVIRGAHAPVLLRGCAPGLWSLISGDCFLPNMRENTELLSLPLEADMENITIA